MDTVIALSIKDIVILLVGISIFIFFIYLAMLIKNLIPTVKKTNEVMDDVKTITDIAADNVESLQETIVNLSSSAETLSKAVSGNTNMVKALGSIGSAIASIIGLVKKNNDDNSSKDESNE